MKLKVSFPAGAYSANKDDIKKVFSILDFKYKSGNQINDKLICIWKREPEKQTIKAVFNGSGKECDFIIECNDDEVNIFKSFEKFNGRVSSYNEESISLEGLKSIAKKNVDKWWTWQKPYKGEPQFFFIKRMGKDKISYQWFIEREYNRLRENSSL